MSNIEKIRKMAKGIYKRPIQVGYEGKKTSQRKEGEEWVDPRGHKWVIKDGKRKQITKIPPRGFDKCGTCDKMILKDIDQDTFNRMSRCYHCQLEFEADLHRKGEWQDWVKEMETKRWESVLSEYEQEMKEIKEKNQFDEKVAHAIGKESHR